MPVSHTEKIISAIGGFIGVLAVFSVSTYLLGARDAPWVIASMGASTVLVFAVPHGQLSQPWAVVGGHISSAIVGVTCAHWISQPILAAALSVSLAIVVMYYLRCIHPPGGATALTAVIGGKSIQGLGYQYVIAPVLINVIIVILMAIVFNYLFPWRRYPVELANQRFKFTRPFKKNIPTIKQSDLEYALSQMDSYIDVTEEDLKQIYLLASQRTYTEHPMTPSQIKLNHYYSNAQYGHHWAVRQIVAVEQDEITYKVVAGKNRRELNHCSRIAFVDWAVYEVVRNENSWQKAGKI